MQEILFPILTGFTLVFAGILVGYFLWFRDRSDQLMLSGKLASENERLSSELANHSARCVETEEDLSRLELKNTSLQQLCDDLLNSREKVQLQVNDLETELYSARTRLDKSRDELTEASCFRAKTEESLHLAKQQYLDRVAELEDQWKEKYSQSQSSLQQGKSEVIRLTDVNGQLAERLHSANSEVAELKSELNAQRAILDQAKTNAVGLEKEYVSMETTMRSQIEQLNESRGQTAAAVSAKNLAEEAIAANDIQIHDLQQRILELETENSAHQKIHDRCEHLEMSLQIALERMESLVLQRDDAHTKRQQSEQELGALRKRTEIQRETIEKLRIQTIESDQRQLKINAGLINQVKQLEAANSDLLRESGEQSQRFIAAEKSRARNDETLMAVSEENASLLAKLSAVAKMEQESVVLSAEYKTRIESVLGQRDNAMEQLESLKDELKRVRQHAKSNAETIRNLRRERGAILMRNKEMSAPFPRIHNESLQFTKADQLSSEYGGTITTDPVRGPIFVEAPRERDDLKRIFGIAEVLERRLNEFGIYTFKQIMEWDERAIQEFSELLVFKDRIYRDDWLGQAAQFYFEKTGAKAA